MRCLQWIRPSTALSLLRSHFGSHSGFIDLCVVCNGPSSLLRKAVRSVRGTDGSTGRRVSPIIAKSWGSWVFWQKAPDLQVTGYKNPTAFLYHSRNTATASLAFLYTSPILYRTFSLLSGFALFGGSSFSDSKLCPTLCNGTVKVRVYYIWNWILTWLSVCIRYLCTCDVILQFHNLAICVHILTGINFDSKSAPSRTLLRTWMSTWLRVLELHVTCILIYNTV